MEAVRPVRPAGHDRAWDSLVALQLQIREWISKDELQLTNIHGKLARRGVLVQHRTRFAAQRCGFPQAS